MMRMFLLDCGIIQLPRSAIIQDAGSQGDPTELLPLPIEAFLLEHNDGWILFDSGCDPDGISGNWPEDYRKIPFEGKYLPERLKALGVKPDDIRYVVASHLHFDHAGCLHLFKRARIFVNQAELDKTRYGFENRLDINAHLGSDIENWNRADLTWEKIPSDVNTRKLVDGVTILNFGSGHSWGMLGLMVELPSSGNYFLVSDTIYAKINHGPPERLPVMISDIDGYRKTVKVIESYASKYNATIVYGHDLAQFTSLLEKPGGCME
ncbi:MAG: N-acyl homoserine lactonase family protein [Rectinemataceae bacterium]